MILKGASAEAAYLKLIDVTYSYRRGNFTIKKINQVFHRGEFTAITGPNGSGKTTLGKLMAGIFKPDKGKVLINGRDSKEISLGEIGKMVGYLFQQPERQLFTPTVEKEVGFALEFMGESPEVVSRKVDRMLESFSLSELKDSSTYRLSAGERQRLALAAVLINQPQFLILDEPTTGLDPVRKQRLADILTDLKREDIGLAVISHDQAFIKKNADRVIVMAGGEVIETGSQV